MRKFVIESVVKTRPWINGIHVHLDDPAEGTFASPRYGLSLRGWVVSPSEQIANISLGCYDKRIADAKIVARGDVEAAYPGNRHIVGFSIDAVPAVLGESEPLKIIVDTTDDRSSTVFEITLRFIADAQAPPPDATPTFAPIIASPRSGTTFLSQLLHAHDEVFKHREYPYEARFGTTFAEEWFANLQPCFYEPEGSHSSESIDQNPIATLADLDNGNAANHARLGDYFATMRQQYRQRIVDLYKMLSTGRAVSASVIIEKFDLQWDLDLTGGLFEQVRPIFIVRDPRDMLVSMRALNAQRGLYESHEVHAKDFGSLVPAMAGNLMRLACLYDRYPGEKLLVSYEELVSEPTTTLHRVLSFIGIDNSADTIAQLLQASAVQVGQTTSSPSSVDCWREALTHSETQMANWFFEPFMRRFGYAE